jgi:hypothetical protein
MDAGLLCRVSQYCGSTIIFFVNGFSKCTDPDPTLQIPKKTFDIFKTFFKKCKPKSIFSKLLTFEKAMENSCV